MSVELYPIISTEQKFSEQLEEGDFMDLAFEEESIKVEELPTQTYISAELVSCYDQFSTSLPPITRAALDDFFDVVCWDYRDAPQYLDSEFQPDGIHCSCAPAKCSQLALALAAVDGAAVRKEFILEDQHVPTADFFLEYVEAWRSIFQRAADLNQFVFAIVP